MEIVCGLFLSILLLFLGFMLGMKFSKDTIDDVDEEFYDEYVQATNFLVLYYLQPSKVDIHAVKKFLQDIGELEDDSDLDPYTKDFIG